jgi:membrane protease YdiL (CAAX protease family)
MLCAPVWLSRFGGVITSATFGLAHGFAYADGAVNLEPGTILMPGVLGLTFFRLKERTGNLIMPIATHNVINLGFQFL